MIQERFLKVDDNIKLHIKEKQKKIVYSYTTNMKSPAEPLKTKVLLIKSNLYRVTIQPSGFHPILNMLTHIFGLFNFTTQKKF